MIITEIEHKYNNNITWDGAINKLTSVNVEALYIKDGVEVKAEVVIPSETYHEIEGTLYEYLEVLFYN